MSDRKQVILNVVHATAVNFLYQDRKECAELRIGALEEAVEAGEITTQDIIDKFAQVVNEKLA